MTSEQVIPLEAVITPTIRYSHGDLAALGASIRDEGMRHPLVLWADGTLISGARRYRACLMMGGRFRQVPVVYVDTIEDAAKRLLVDNEDDHLALPMTMSEVCRLWQWLRKLDEPAALLRADHARRRGAVLREQVMAGQRPPGRHAVSEDYVLNTLCGPFGISSSTAKRLWAIYAIAYLKSDVTPERRAQARRSLDSIDSGESSIWANYYPLVAGRSPAPVAANPPVEIEPAPAARQLAAWDRSLPQLEGLMAGLMELGAPNDDLTWAQVKPVVDRLAAVRRNTEKLIKKMRESNPS